MPCALRSPEACLEGRAVSADGRADAGAPAARAGVECMRAGMERERERDRPTFPIETGVTSGLYALGIQLYAPED